MTKFASVSLKIEHLACMRGYKTLFGELNLSLKSGDLMELRGPNGCGKSTLLRCIAGLTGPSAGRIVWDDDVEATERLHYVGHFDAIKPQETVLQQAAFWASFLGVSSPRKAARQALKQVGLGNRLSAPGRGLSAGQRRRLALTRLIMASRPVWLLDEPLAALDSDGQLLVRELVAHHQSHGGIVIAAMHGEGFEGACTLNVGDFAPSQTTPAGGALMSSSLMVLFTRELRLAWSGGGGAALPVGFYAGAATLTPLALGPAPDLLQAAGPGILFITLALASLLPMERLFQADLEDGTLDVLGASGVSLAGVALTKTAAHWMTSGLPLALIAPILWIMLQGTGSAIGVVLAATISGSLAFFFIGSVGAALAAGVRRGGLLIALTALPLYAPATIFGASALYAVSEGRAFGEALNLCIACALASAALGPFAAGAALKTALD